MRSSYKVLLPLLGVFLVALLVSGAYHWATVRAETCTVTGKDRVSTVEGNSDMRVYTKDCGTFIVKDIPTKGIFNSADIYGKLEEGKSYTLTYSGFRVPLVSAFPYIQKAEEVPQN